MFAYPCRDCLRTGLLSAVVAQYWEWDLTTFVQNQIATGQHIMSLELQNDATTSDPAAGGGVQQATIGRAALTPGLRPPRARGAALPPAIGGSRPPQRHDTAAVAGLAAWRICQRPWPRSRSSCW
jgi:hypothetical protein